MDYKIKKIEESDILPTLYKVNGRLKESHNNTIKLVNDLGGHSSEVAKVKKKYDEHWAFSTPSRSELFELIQSDQKSNSSSTRTISNLVKNINENIDDLSKMTGVLARLSCMTFEDLSKAYQEINNNKNFLDGNYDATRKTQSSLNRVIKSYIKKAEKDQHRDTLLDESQEKINQLLESSDISVNEKLAKLDTALNQVSDLKGLNQKMNSKLKYFRVLSVVSILVSLFSILFVVALSLKIFTV